MRSRPNRLFQIGLGLSLLVAAAASAGTASAQPGGDEGRPQKLYELRYYLAAPGKIDALHARFRDHTMKLFEKHGMENVIYWNVVEGDKTDEKGEAERTLVYIVAHEDKEAHDKSWAAFRGDPEWQKVLAESEKDGKLLAEPPRVILMKETDFSPLDWPPSDDKRLYELRHYNDGPDRVSFTVERFGSGEDQLFRDAGMETIKFWRATDDSAFIYLLSHGDRDQSKASWQKFMTAFRPFMEKYKAEKPQPPADAAPGKGIEARFLVPTDYSPRK